MKTITTFSAHSELEKAKSCLVKLSLPYQTISPEMAYAKVGVPAIILDQSVRSRLHSLENIPFLCSGWVDYHPSQVTIPQDKPPSFQKDLMGACSIVVLAPCMADINRIRLIAHLSGDLTEVFPYLNTEMPQGMYN